MKTKDKHDFYNIISRFIFFGGIFLILFFFIQRIEAILTPFIVSFILAYLFAPVNTRMQHKLKLGKNFSSAIIIFLTQIILILILTIGTPALYNQVVALIKTIPLVTELVELKVLPLLPEAITQIYFETSKSINIDLLINQAFSLDKTKVVEQAYSSGKAIASAISTFFLIPIVSFYMLRDWQGMHKATLTLIPIKYKKEFEEIIHEIRKKVSDYVTGEFYAIFILSFMYGIGLVLAGLKFGFLIGVLTAVLSIVPYIGFTICFLLAIIIAFATSMPIAGVLIVAGVLIAVQVIESNYIIPKFVGGKIGLHPVWIIFGLLAGGALLGFVGLLLAIPITTIISVLLKHYVNKYKKSEFYES